MGMNMMLGIVEDNADPKRLGRVKIRVPSKHGIEDNSVDTEALPWTDPSPPFYSGHQYGSYAVPRVGSMVWLLEQEDQGSFFLGASHGAGSDGEKEFDGELVPEGESEVPEIIDEENFTNSAVLFQSPGGEVMLATIEDETLYMKSEDANIKLSEDKIEATSGESASIKMDSDKIEIKLGSASITLKDDQVNIVGAKVTVDKA